MSRTCPKCKAENRDQARFCHNCSAPLEGGANAESPVRLCPAGRHAMDPGWQVCPYCASESSNRADTTHRSVPVRELTVAEDEPARPPRPPVPPPIPPPLPFPPRPDAAAEKGGAEKGGAEKRGAEKREATVFGAEGEPPRRIVGVLVTYTWRPDGEMFPVREGRNVLGSSPECEIRISTDPRMSSRHACIVHRPGGFWIDDEKSMNGTFLGEESVDEKRRLPDSAVIRTGETVWRFTAIEPPPEK